MKLTAWEHFPYSVRKAWRVMRITTFLILVISLHLSAKTTAQKITLSSTNISIEQFFDQLEKQTGYSFLLENGVVSRDEKISVNVKDAPLETVLDQILKPIKLSYKIENKTVFILKTPQPFTSGTRDLSSLPPPIDIHGHVTDSLGNPLAGASISVKGSKKGTSTDTNGDFILHGVNENALITISFTGYNSKKINLNGTNSFTVALTRSTGLLDQVQIIAYGTTTQRLTTGDQTTVTSEVIERQPVSNPIFALEGRVPGLNIVQNSGVPGSGFSVQIRGRNSIDNINGPLYVVDGVPYTYANFGQDIGYNATLNVDKLNPLNFINPLDIESIDVLKDADATAIYGSTGANGVVLITTKKGKQGKTTVNANIYYGAGSVGHYIDLMNTQQYLMMKKEAFSNDGVVPDPTIAPEMFFDSTKNTDWQKKLIGGSSALTNAQLTISGGSKNTQFSISGNYKSTGSVSASNLMDKTGSFNLSLNNVSENQRFRTNVNVIYLSDNNNLPSFDLTYMAMYAPPNSPDFIDNKGNLLWAPNFYFNPYAYLKSQYISKGNNLVGSANVHYQILPELEMLADFGFVKTNMNEIVTNPLSSLDPRYGYTGGYSTFSNSDNQTWNIEPQINWKKNVLGGKLNVLIGTTFREATREQNVLRGKNYSDDALIENISSAGTITSQSAADIQYRYTALFGRINYNYADKYIISLNGRRDGSSRFGPGKQFANFGSIGAAWIFSKENLIKDNLSFLSFGKLRASYGSTGNDQIPDYGYVQLWGANNYPWLNSNTIQPLNLSNPVYSWEINKKFEIGINLGFVNDKILIEADYYRNVSSNQLVSAPLPGSVGFTSIQANLPATVQNTGFEAQLTTTNIKNSGFTWTTSFNISVPRNKLVSFPNIKNTNYAYTYTVGKSLYVKELYHYISVNPTTGIYQYQSVQGDSATSTPSYPQDLQPLKQVAQDFYGGLDNTFKFKGFELDIFFQFVKQTGYNALLNGIFGPPGGQPNQPVAVLDRWQKPGDNAPFQKYTSGFGSDYSAVSAFYNGSGLGDNSITDASFIRLKNVSLSYQVPEKWIQNLKLDRARIYLQGQNLWTITSYKGMDPEFNTVGNLPPLRVLTAGIQLIF